jgi:hypothetical protein
MVKIVSPRAASICTPVRCNEHKETKLTIIPQQPGNQPDTNNRSGAFENRGDAHDPATIHSDMEEEEDDAERLGDFA